MKLALATTALAALALPAAAAKDRRSFAVLHFNNKQLTKARVDPIVNPGTVATHVHSVLGGSGFGISANGTTLQQSKCSTAKVKGDNSNYWFPSLYFRDPETGKLEDVELFYANAYYFFEPTNDDIKAFPLGLNMLSGDVAKRSPPPGGASSNLDPSKGPVNPIKWTCPRKSFDPPSWPAGSDGTMAGIGDPGNKGEGVGFPDFNCDGYASPLRADVHFPSCYNPDAGLTGYKSNMVFPSDSGHGKKDCPKGHVHLPHLFLEVYWNTPLFKDRWEQGKSRQPFVLSNGDATGYSLHADFLAGWDEKLLQHIIDTCDAGTSGMDKCPGLFYGLNEGDCTIASPVDETTDGVLDALPGGNRITGWAFGGGGASPPPSGSDAPTATAPRRPGTSSKPSSKPTTGRGSSSGGGGQLSTKAPDKTATARSTTVYGRDTVTLTGPTPGATTAPASHNTTRGPVGGFQYAGCFKDSSDRALRGEKRPNLGAMSNDKCVAHCKAAGYALAGTEYGGQCYCGNELVGSERLDDSSRCRSACEGDPADVCGGSWALSVYSKDGQASIRAADKGRRHAKFHEHARRHRSPLL